MPSHDTPFSVDPPNGQLLTKETKKITFHFAPNKVASPHTVCCIVFLVQAASYVDMGHLVLTGIDSNEPLDSTLEEFDWLRLSASEVIVLCVQVSAMAKVLCILVKL